QFERRLAPTATIAAVYALQPFALLVLLLGPLAVAPYAFVVLFGAGRGADTLIRNTAVARLYGARRFARIQGVLSLIIPGPSAGSAAEHILATLAELEADASAQHVDRRFVRAVVMPSRERVTLGLRDAGPHRWRADGLFALHARRLGRFALPLRGAHQMRLVIGHRVRPPSACAAPRAARPCARPSSG